MMELADIRYSRWYLAYRDIVLQMRPADGDGDGDGEVEITYRPDGAPAQIIRRRAPAWTLSETG